MLNPFSTAVPIWGQTSLIPSGLSPKRDWGPKRVEVREVDCSPNGPCGCCAYISLALGFTCFLFIRFPVYASICLEEKRVDLVDLFLSLWRRRWRSATPHELLHELLLRLVALLYTVKFVGRLVGTLDLKSNSCGKR